MSTIPELLIVSGVQKDSRYAVPPSGLRLGRSPSCEISVKDPALSRNHCLFEFRDGSLWVTDLASANGTLVNDVALGADSHPLKPGDRVVAGDVVLAVVEPGAAAPEGLSAAEPTVDLGFGAPEQEGAQSGAATRRLLLWAVAVLAVAGSAALVFMGDGETAPVAAPAAVEPADDVLHALAFEKVEADAKGIYRYALSVDRAGRLAVAIDDVPKENRHVRKSAQLSGDARTRLDRLLASESLYQLDREYTGVPLEAGALKGYSLRVVRGGRVFDVSIENAQEPPAFHEVRERLETFANNELGLWAIQYSAEKLLAMSAESRRAGDAKWAERDVQYGNLAAALAAYNEAMFYLETVDPKPADYADLVGRRDEVAKELDTRYRNQLFQTTRASNLGDWKTAQRELRILCEMVPDARDPRHAEAAAKLLDVEARLKKGDK